MIGYLTVKIHLISLKIDNMKSLQIFVLLWIILTTIFLIYWLSNHEIDWYKIIEVVSEKVSCITWPHKDITPPYLIIESNNAYLVVGDDWQPTYYLKNADCQIYTTRVWSPWNLNKWFWGYSDWLGINSNKFSCDYLNYAWWSCSELIDSE